MMILADVLKIVLLILAVFCVIISYWLATEALFPGFTRKVRRRYEKPLLPTILGLGVVVVEIVIAAGAKSVLDKAADPINVFLISLFVFFGLLGSVGLCQRVRLGMPSPVDGTQPWRRTLRAGIVLTFVFLLPGPGWVLLIWAGISGCGAVVLSFFEPAPSDMPTHPTANKTLTEDSILS
ncbi:MAG: hypothetical protein QGG39_07010 [Candidatus Poribacteria bacterium]|jgi:amino acid permease|nr:hypothetical protein [Candidatus Poribacteria bacterium]